MRCPRCHLADIPEGARTCVRCGHAPAGQRGAPGTVPEPAGPDERASSEPDVRRPEWVPTKRRSGPAPPVVIMDDGDEDEDADDDRDWAPRPSKRIGARVVAAVGTASVPAPFASPDVVGLNSSPPPVPTPAPPDPAVPHAVPPARLPAPVAAAPVPRPKPPSVTRPVTPRRTAPPPPRVERTAEPGLLSINAIPWGSVYIDGRPVGNTPQIDRRLAPGSHELRVEREGFRPYQRVIDVAPGQRLRITDITLVER